MRFVSPFAAFAGFASIIHAAAPPEYCPLGEKMEWVMEVKFVFPNGAVETTTGHRRLVQKESWGGKEYYIEQSWTDRHGGSDQAQRYVRKDESGVFTFNPYFTDEGQQRVVALPLVVGNSWSHLDIPIHVKSTVLADESLTIAGVTYEHCFHIHAVWEDGSRTKDYWEAPTVGTVKSELVYQKGNQNGHKEIWTLREFKAGKK